MVHRPENLELCAAGPGARGFVRNRSSPPARLVRKSGARPAAPLKVSCVRGPALLHSALFQLGLPMPRIARDPDPSIIDLKRLQELFHGLIRSRCREGGLPIPRLPSLARQHPLKEAPAWFPVPGMTGGFSYWFDSDARKDTLIVESWSRVVGGSGLRHRITSLAVILEDQGFV